MNIFICASKHFYDKIPPIKHQLEQQGHHITLPNSFDNPNKEHEMKLLGEKQHAAWKRSMLLLQEEKVNQNDAVLVLNFEKNGIKNYIGGATFLEIFIAFRQNKKIFFYNPLPEGILQDELKAMEPKIIYGDLKLVK